MSSPLLLPATSPISLRFPSSSASRSCSSSSSPPTPTTRLRGSASSLPLLEPIFAKDLWQGYYVIESSKHRVDHQHFKIQSIVRSPLDNHGAILKKGRTAKWQLYNFSNFTLWHLQKAPTHTKQEGRYRRYTLQEIAFQFLTFSFLVLLHFFPKLSQQAAGLPIGQ